MPLTLPENDPTLTSFLTIAADSPFPIQNLPFAVFSHASRDTAHVGVAIGDWVLDLTVLEAKGYFAGPLLAGKFVFADASLAPLMAMGRLAAREARATVSQLLQESVSTLRDNTELRQQALVSRAEVSMHLPCEITAFTDFYSSKEHASNLGKMFRNADNPLLPNWLHMPVAYDGRARSVVVSGTDFYRPQGQIKTADDAPPIHSPSQKLDVEIEVGFLIGQPSQFGQPISVNSAAEHVFGLTLVNDWSARDIQKWEYVPLGPFLGKNFCTSISPWVVTLDALEPFRVAGPSQEPEPLSYLQNSRDWNFNIELAITLQTKSMTQPEVIATPNAKTIYWDCCQELAHHTVNGCPMQTGDLFASGTVSGADANTYGSLIELTWAGQQPIQLSNGEQRVFLQDGDTVTMSGYCQGHGYRVGFGEVTGTVLPAIDLS